MNHPSMAPDIVQHPSQGSNNLPQNSQPRSRTRQSTAEHTRSYSTTTASRISRPSRSRGSTASIHSNTAQYNPDQHVTEGYQSYINPEPGPSQHIYHSNPEEMIIRFGDQLANSNSGNELHTHNLPIHGLPIELPPNGNPSDVPPGNYTQLYDSVDPQLPDHLLGENEGSEAGPRKRRGTTTAIANDNELRRLLRQYDGYSLHEMAAEVQRHDGTGGKSEKVKQVFAMIWLRENCQKSFGSVRRDRVYCSYAEKCGTERVSVLNPASFGKLVRIIFPNVQTRRLGVRGESKYHYVDLTIREPNPNPPTEIPEKNAEATPSRQKMADKSQESTSQQQSTTSTDFTSSRKITSPTPDVLQPSPSDHLCDHLQPSELNIMETVETPLIETQQLMNQLLQFSRPNESPPIDNDSLQLPSIHGYLPANTDSESADALAALYRSHCISVIDSFRYCKEKNLFRHFASFQGTLTVPVHKLLNHPNVAPWIKECDWLMYQKMIAFVAPLTTQVVPDPVLNAFGSISRGLVSHIKETLKSHPDHVCRARLSPARIFCRLLKRMLDVNQSAIAASAWLCHAENRTKMWEDFVSYIEPMDIVAMAKVPNCSVGGVLDIMKHQVKSLIAPDDDKSPDTQLYGEPFSYQKLSYSSTDTSGYAPFPDRWIAFILNLPVLFPNHKAQCIIDRADAIWTRLLHRLTLGGAQSFSAWWMTKVFFSEMMLWQAEKGGFMGCTAQSFEESSLARDLIQGVVEPRSVQSASANSDTNWSQNSRLRASRSQLQPQLPNIIPIVQASPTANLPTSDISASISKISGNDKTIAATNGSVSPSNRNLTHDDSAIDLEDDSALLNANKYGDMMASDPADAEGQVVVV
ncbi:hypothetical protein I7I50_03756 [Histoplasma capsulatum G186AR]|uniref:RFX-type winged-helix domain-containing protein n=1 Tax=Ajellomyces capsulatus TaxID=5037 RepID=A0A8H8CWQ0_AJECA|nr:hypothetical protein I7I52_04663 [Histoplasma capsulatum]QSS74822.1 hypothetical protein I7I50_03756 [Histoplasma capsulatum G186AR]